MRNGTIDPFGLRYYCIVMCSRYLPHGSYLLFSLLCTAVVAVCAVHLTVPPLHRRAMLNELICDDPVRQDRGLRFIRRQAAQDERVVWGAIVRLATADDHQFRQIAAALDSAGQWRHPPVDDEVWLRWLTLLTAETEPVARMVAARRLGELNELAHAERVTELLNTLTADADADVRCHGLFAVAELASSGAATDRYHELLLRALDDHEPEVARQAWLLAGLLDLGPLPRIAWHQKPPRVAEAALWTMLRIEPDDAGPAVEVIGDHSVDPRLRAMAAYALHMSGAVEARDTLRHAIKHARHDEDDTDMVVAWRAILAIRLDPIGSSDGLRDLLWSIAAVPKGGEPHVSLWPLILAATYRVGRAVAHDASWHSKSGQPESQHIALWRLAALERPSADGPMVRASDLVMPDMLRLAAASVTTNPRAEDLRPLLLSEQAPMRDLATVVAARRLSRRQNEQLVESLLRDFDDRAKMSGAILAGLTGMQPQLLHQKMNDEDAWAVQQVHRLGRWMQGAMPQMRHHVSGLLGRADVPESTVMLAMVHSDLPTALDYLLRPRGEPPVDLVELFDHYRWWRVLEHYLPEDAPPFWVWSDRQLQQFQIEVLRNWYLVNRRRLAS